MHVKIEWPHNNKLLHDCSIRTADISMRAACGHHCVLRSVPDLADNLGKIESAIIRLADFKQRCNARRTKYNGLTVKPISESNLRDLDLVLGSDVLKVGEADGLADERVSQCAWQTILRWDPPHSATNADRTPHPPVSPPAASLLPS